MTRANIGRERVRVGLVGSGQRAAYYFRNVPDVVDDSAQLEAIADPDVARRAAFAELLGARPELLDDGPAMIDDRELDAVLVATPNDLHVPSAVAAMERGLPLLLEKPVATTLEGLSAL